MGLRASDVMNGASQGRAPGAKLGPQVTPLVFELADGFRKTRPGARAAELRAVEDEAAALRLGVNMGEVGVDERDGVRPVLKTAKLGDQEEKLNRLLQELAWDAVTHHPLSGVKPAKTSQ